MYHLVRLCSKRNMMQRYVSKERETRLYCKICNKKTIKRKYQIIINKKSVPEWHTLKD